MTELNTSGRCVVLFSQSASNVGESIQIDISHKVPVIIAL